MSTDQPTARSYTFTYDPAKRLTQALYAGASGENFTVDRLSYDASSQIKTLRRFGAPGGGILDDLSYTHQGVRLTRVSDSQTNTLGGFIPRGQGNYTYNASGQLVSDANEQIREIVYHTYYDLPARIFLTDHLGNVRASINRQGQLISSSHFDPWGHRLQGLGTTAAQLTNRWELQGKERDLTFGLNRINFGARVYNPTIGVWDQVDPLADERIWVSPYNFNQNNPINRIDPTGALDEPCCGDPGGMLLTEAKSQWDAANSYGRGLLQRVEGSLATILSYTRC